MITNLKTYAITLSREYWRTGLVLSRLFNIKRKKFGHISLKTKMCVLPLISYDDKTETLDYGQCFTIDVVSMSLSSLTIRHYDNIKKGDILEFRTKHALEDHQCLKCMNFKTLPETPSLNSFIGKIIWRNSSEAGVSIIMMKEQDREAVKKLINEKNI